MMTKTTPLGEVEPKGEGRGRAIVALAGWLGAAIAVSRVVDLPRAPAVVPLSLVGGVAALVVAYRTLPWARAFADGLDERAVLLFHAARLPIGAAFLVEGARGRLPAIFAERAGVGDVIAGGLALVLAATLPAGGRAGRRAVLAWNALGLADILMVVATAQYLLFVKHDALLLAGMARFPYPLLPTFVVPLVVATHALLFVRGAASAPARDAAAR